MTKQYIRFEELKQLLEEADESTSKKRYVQLRELQRAISEAEKKAAWQGAILWAIVPDTADSKRKIFEYYCATLNNSHERSTFGDLMPLLSTMIYPEITSTGGIQASTIRGPTTNTSPISDSYEYKGTYNLYYNTISFEADDTIVDTIKEKCKNAFTIYTRKEKVYVCYELNKKNTNLDVTDQATAKKAAFAGVKRIVESPESFTGYKSIKDVLKTSAEMSTIDFLKKYSGKGIVGALLLKAGINLAKYVMDKRKRNKAGTGSPSPTGTPTPTPSETPQWKASSELQDMTLRVNEKKEIMLSDCIDNYDKTKMKCTVDPSTNCTIESNEKIVFEIGPLSTGSINYTFTVSPISGSGFTPIEKTITVIVN